MMGDVGPEGKRGPIGPVGNRGPRGFAGRPGLAGPPGDIGSLKFNFFSCRSKQKLVGSLQECFELAKNAAGKILYSCPVNIKKPTGCI